MNKYETYRANVDVYDKFDIKNDVIGRNMCCRLRHLNIINRRNAAVAEVEREAQPLAAAVLGINNTTIPKDHSVPPTKALSLKWTDMDEQQLFLDTKPNCYLIISKPGTGAYSLGEAMAKKFKCIHICPRNVLIDEIEQKSPTGKCVDFNIKHYKECKINIIMAIIKQKIQSPAVKHRGYVLSGLPLVSTSRSEISFFKKLHSEEAVLVVEELVNDFVLNLKKKKKRAKAASESGTSLSVAPGEAWDEGASEEEEEEVVPDDEEEEEEQVVELPKFVLEPCENIIFTKRNYYDIKEVLLANQINQLLKLDLKPDIIIYITSPDEDLVVKKNHTYLNYSSNSYIADPISSAPTTEQKWPPKYILSDCSAQYVTENQNINKKYNVRQPMNHKESSTEQLCNYRKYVYPYLKRKIKDINPKLIIKVDGRTTTNHMMYHIIERLHLLPRVKPVLVPEPLYLEEPPDDMEEFWKLIEELNVIESEGLTFNRYASPWYNRCPVELKKRHTVIGKPKFAVSLFKHVYLLSSLEALISFCRNPRPYLKLYYLEPPCRIIVIGTKSSGKTMVSECLSWIFDVPIIPYQDIYAEEKQKKYDNLAKTILSEIIPTLEDARYEQWQKEEATRISQLEIWHGAALNNLKRYTILFSEYDNLKKIPGSLARPQNAGVVKKLQTVKEQLTFLPFIDDIEQCRTALNSKNILEYAPASLTIIKNKPGIPVMGDPDVTQAISDYITTNELQNEVEPTPEEIMAVITEILKNIDNEAQEAHSTYGQFIIDGFTPNPEYWTPLKDSNLLPDYTISIVENREIDQELMQYYLKIEKTLKHHRERFLEADDPFIQIKLKTDEKHPELSNSFHVSKVVQDTIVNIIESIVEEEEFDSEQISAFSQIYDKFKEDWDGTKPILEETFKSYIEVELEGKSDIKVLEEVLLKLRQSYCMPCEQIETEDVEPEEEEEKLKDLLTFNDPRFLCETGVYCPISYFDYSVLWEGKPEFTIKHGNKLHFFAKEECLEIFRKDITKYQTYSKPFKNLPAWRICVMGCIGSGRTTVSKFIAKELGLMHIDFEKAVNNFIMPRHFKKVGRQYENGFSDASLDEEAVVEFQMDEENENLMSDIRGNETEMRRMVYNYFERGTPLLSVLMQTLLKKLWFEEPFVNIGFVLDGFPKVSNDVEDMVACFCVPDLIIELESNSEIALQRLSSMMFKKWKMQQNEAKAKAFKKFNDIKSDWREFIMKQVIVNVTIDDLLTNVMSVEEPAPVASNQSIVFDADPEGTGTGPLDPRVFSTYNEMIEQYPEPVDDSQWEKSDEARERIDGRIEAIFETEEENIQNLKDILSEQRIKFLSLDSTKSLFKVYKNVLAKLSTLRERCAFFEQTLRVNCDVADVLLSEGFYFLSKCSRMCPVYIAENPTTLFNPYRVSRSKGTIFPVIHRCYIYFIHGEEAVKKFRKNPLRYATNDNIREFHEHPLRIGVIGPPKSGKSCLAARLAQEYGLLCVSKGTAIRNVMENLSWSRLAFRMSNSLKEGKCINYEDIVMCIQTALIDYRAWVHGFVLDGLPERAPVAMGMAKDGLYPQIIFELTPTNDNVIKNSQNEVYFDILKLLPPYSPPYIQKRFVKWHAKSYGIRNYVSNDCQNLITIDGNQSKWQCYQDAKDYIDKISPKVHYYIANVGSDLVLPADVMCIANAVFKKRSSAFRNLCPVCLRNKFLRHSGEPVDKKGIVQYQGQFYWVCHRHMQMVIDDPKTHLNTKRLEIPEIPAVVKTIDIHCVYENGICIVTYAENLPAQIIKSGSNKFAARYKKKQYMFCSERCLKKFLARPHMYYDIVVFKEMNCFPQLSLKKLPNIGYLEQTVGEILTKACCAVNVIRPKYPGLDAKTSALLYIALYLKVNNPLLDANAYKLYRKAFDIYEARSKYILSLGLRLRSMDNPFVSYPMCCPADNSSTFGRLASV